MNEDLHRTDTAPYLDILASSYQFTLWATLTYRPQCVSRSKSFIKWSASQSSYARGSEVSKSGLQASVSDYLHNTASTDRYVSLDKAKKHLQDYQAALKYLQSGMTIKLLAAVEGVEERNTHIHLLAYNWNLNEKLIHSTWPHGFGYVQAIDPEDQNGLLKYMFKDCVKYDTDHLEFKYLGRNWMEENSG
jgi:hypothetical protein